MKKISRHLNTARFLVDVMENKFKIGRFSFGLDPVLGLIPGGGDLVSFIISLYIVWIGIQLRLPADKVIQMMANVLYDLFLGIIPIIGDISDFVFKANTKNLKIIEEFTPKEFVEGVIV